MTAAWRARLCLALVLVTALVVQTTLGADLRVAGVAPDLLLLCAISAGLVCGAETGASVGFCATTTPVGFFALSWCLVGFAVGAARTAVLPEGRLIQPALAFAATIAGLILLLIVGELVGQTQLISLGRSYVVRLVAVESLWDALLVIPVAAVFRWAGRGSAGLEALRRPETVGVR